LVVAGFISAHSLNQASLFRVFAKIKPPQLSLRGFVVSPRLAQLGGK
jgi:hypothetical protein